MILLDFPLFDCLPGTGASGYRGTLTVRIVNMESTYWGLLRELPRAAVWQKHGGTVLLEQLMFVLADRPQPALVYSMINHGAEFLYSETYVPSMIVGFLHGNPGPVAAGCAQYWNELHMRVAMETDPRIIHGLSLEMHNVRVLATAAVSGGLMSCSADMLSVNGDLVGVEIDMTPIAVPQHSVESAFAAAVGVIGELRGSLHFSEG